MPSGLMIRLDTAGSAAAPRSTGQAGLPPIELQWGIGLGDESRAPALQTGKEHAECQVSTFRCIRMGQWWGRR